jgi:hypothetical protein
LYRVTLLEKGINNLTKHRTITTNRAPLLQHARPLSVTARSSTFFFVWSIDFGDAKASHNSKKELII